MSENLSVIRRSVALEPVDDRVVRALAKKKGLGSRGYSSALRMIIREWREYQREEFQAARVFSDRVEDLQERTPAGGVMPAGALDGGGE